MTDYTIDDLVSDSGNSQSDESGGSSTGEWVVDLVDKLDDRGYLGPLIFGGEPRDVEEISAEQSDIQAGESPAGVDAEQVKTMMLKLYDHSGQIPGLSDDPSLSELIQLIDQNPELADQLIGEYV